MIIIMSCHTVQGIKYNRRPNAAGLAPAQPHTATSQHQLIDEAKKRFSKHPL